jgi:hypothetical protein
MEKPISDYVAVSNANPTMSGNVYWDNRTDATPYPSSVPNSPSTPTSPSAPTAPSAPKIASFSTDSGVAGDGVTNDKTLVVTGTAAANGSVKVFDGATQIGTATANSSGSWSYTTSALSDGNHSLTATVTNSSGTSAASAALAVKIDTTAPNAPTIGTPSNNTSGGVNLTGTAEANSTVKVFDGTTQIGTATANSNGAWTYATSALTTGSHSITAKAMDAAGNTGAASAAVIAEIGTLSTQPAPSAPSIASFSNDSGVAGDRVTNDNTLELKGTAAAGSAVTVYDGSTKLGTTTASSTGSWDYITQVLTDAKHTLTAVSSNSSGQTSSASAALAVTVDTKGPTAPTIASDTVNSANQVVVSGNAAEANSTVKVYDGTTQVGIATANASGVWTVTTSALAAGTHVLVAKATDAAGNEGAASAAFDPVIKPSGSGTSAPTVDTTAPDAPVLLTDTIHHHRATVTGTAEPGSTIRVYEGTTLLGKTTTGADGDFHVTTSGLKTGDHTFIATATDAAGNVSAMSDPLDPPIGSHGSNCSHGSMPMANGTSVEVTNVRQHWDHTATIKGTADPNSQVKLSDGTTSVGSVKAGADGTWSFHTSDLSGKTHAFTADQVDTSGHVVGTSSGEAMVGSGRGNTLTGTTGNDIMVGKGGADTFVFSSNFGRDVIKDFAAGGPSHDTIQFSKSVFDSFASVLSHAAQSGHDVVIATGSDTLTLKNASLDKLNSHDFHFA